MKLFLASPHTLLKFKDGLKAYESILSRSKRQTKDYNSPTGGGGQVGVKKYLNENFWQGGETRHWIQDVTSPTKENEDISSRQHNISSVYRSDSIRGGGALA